MPFPLTLGDIFGHWGSYIVYFAIGIGFGAVLEMAGFGKSTKLAQQFYFKDQTVLKVMFTAIVVAMILIFLAAGLGLLDYNIIYVNPTYLWPGIVGGLIMGFGFVIGGFCPGTSLVAAATLKLDGIIFVIGVFFGIFMFGETVSLIDGFWHSSDMGRFTIQEWLGVDAGIVVLGVMVMAIVAFFAAEQAERFFGGASLKDAPKWRYGAAGVGMIAVVALAFMGQPNTQDRWNWNADEFQAKLDNREVQIHPGELLSLIHDDKITARMLDVRDDADYNIFHILDAENIPLAEIPDHLEEFHEAASNTVFVVMSNNESAATEAWKILVAEGVPNAYILSGGVNVWIDTFAAEDFKDEYALVSMEVDAFAYNFDAALGSRHPAANPNPDVFQLVYEEKVVLETKRGSTSGGCG